MQLFRKKYRRPGDFKKELVRKTRNFFKCVVLLIVPLFPTAAIGAIWYYVFYKHDIHLCKELEGIATAAWIPIFGILYCLIATLVLTTVWTEYKTIRTAVKRYDIETFMDLKDENVSPLVHTLMGVLAFAVQAGFMLLKYPDMLSGLLCVTTTAYLFILLFLVVVEIDNPCSGLWYIRSLHQEWIEIDAREWRRQRCNKARKEFQLEHKKFKQM